MRDVTSMLGIFWVTRLRGAGAGSWPPLNSPGVSDSGMLRAMRAGSGTRTSSACSSCVVIGRIAGFCCETRRLSSPRQQNTLCQTYLLEAVRLLDVRADIEDKPDDSRACPSGSFCICSMRRRNERSASSGRQKQKVGPSSSRGPYFSKCKKR